MSESKSAAPWSIKGIDPEMREMAKAAARRAGMTLGAWLSQKITDEQNARAAQETVAARPTASVQQPESVSMANIGPFAAAVRDVALRLKRNEMRTEEAIAALRDGLEELVGRMDAVVGRIDGISQSVAGNMADVANMRSEVSRLASLRAEVSPQALNALRAELSRDQQTGLEALRAQLSKEMAEARQKALEAQRSAEQAHNIASAAAEDARDARSDAEEARRDAQDALMAARDLRQELGAIEARQSTAEERLENMETRLTAVEDRVTLIETTEHPGYHEVQAAIRELADHLAQNHQRSLEGAASTERALRMLSERLEAAAQRQEETAGAVGHAVSLIAERIDRLEARSQTHESQITGLATQMPTLDAMTAAAFRAAAAEPAPLKRDDLEPIVLAEDRSAPRPRPASTANVAAAAMPTAANVAVDALADAVMQQIDPKKYEFGRDDEAINAAAARLEAVERFDDAPDELDALIAGEVPPRSFTPAADEPATPQAATASPQVVAPQAEPAPIAAAAAATVTTPPPSATPAPAAIEVKRASPDKAEPVAPYLADAERELAAELAAQPTAPRHILDQIDDRDDGLAIPDASVVDLRQRLRQNLNRADDRETRKGALAGLLGRRKAEEAQREQEAAAELRAVDKWDEESAPTPSRAGAPPRTATAPQPSGQHEEALELTAAFRADDEDDAYPSFGKRQTPLQRDTNRAVGKSGNKTDPVDDELRAAFGDDEFDDEIDILDEEEEDAPAPKKKSGFSLGNLFRRNKSSEADQSRDSRVSVLKRQRNELEDDAADAEGLDDDLPSFDDDEADDAPAKPEKKGGFFARRKAEAKPVAKGKHQDEDWDEEDDEPEGSLGAYEGDEDDAWEDFADESPEQATHKKTRAFGLAAIGAAVAAFGYVVILGLGG